MGRSNFGTNLSNHHPIGFIYDTSLMVADSDLVHPDSINLPLRKGEMHCTTCHDPHASDFQPFLLKPSQDGELCESCHNLSGTDWDWSFSSHATSQAIPKAGDPWNERKPEWKGRTVSENACENCHATHNAASPARLIKDNEESTCYRCHDGTVAEFNIRSEAQKFSHHPVESIGRGRHDAAIRETSLRMPFHVECEDCHNPHASRSDVPLISFNPGNPYDPYRSEAPLVNGSMLGVTGLDLSGQQKVESEYEYEICLKCHGVPGRSACDRRRCSTANTYQMVRQDQIYNIRDKINPGNPSLDSYHPFVLNNPANNGEVPSLRIDIPLNRSDSMIYCSDCHASDLSPAAGGDGPTGPHGSRHEPILALPYQLRPGARFNRNSNTMCFKCHDSNNLFNDESFLHRSHVLVYGRTCVNCHDPHGSAKYPHLINFLTFARLGGRSFEITGLDGFLQPRWKDQGRYSGTCYSNCHGVLHEGSSYGIVPEEPELIPNR
jgi:predicted CXXCH cytochrome family protein